MEENQPESGITYSSQDILGSSVAGKNKNFFTRIKQKKQTKQKKPNSISPRKRIVLTKRAKIAIVVIASIIVVVGITIVVVTLISNMNRTDSESDDASNEPVAGGIYDENKSAGEIELEASTMPLDSEDSVQEFEARVNYLATMLDSNEIDAIYSARIANEENEGIKILLEIKHAGFFIGEGRMEEAINILDVISQNEKDLSLIAKRDLYAAYLYYYNTIEGEQDLFEKYDRKLSETTAELYPPTESEVISED